MNSLQKRLYNLLSEVDEICKKHNIQYIIAGGTALGLVRGGDFMPWDDDIDIYISLENWNKLRSIMKSEIPENRDFACEEETPLYCNPVGRYSDKNSTEMRVSQILCGRACGQIIEFFIMDPMPSSEEKKEEFLKLNKVFVELASPYFAVNRDIFGKNRAFDYKLYKKFYRKGLLKGRKKVLEELRNELTRNSESDCQSFAGRWGLETLVYDRSWIKSIRYVEFNNRIFPVSEYAEKIFRNDYGDDWMYVPDNEAKISHDVDRDLETPYEAYTKLYMPLINKKRLLFSYKRNKKASVKCMISREKAFVNFAKFRAKVFEESLLKSGYDIDKINNYLKEKRFFELEIIFEDYYKAQLNKVNRNVGIIVKAPSEFVEKALMSRIMQGRYYSISQVVQHIENGDKNFCDSLRNVIKANNFCKELSIAIYDESDEEKVKKLLDENKNYCGIIIDYDRAKLWVKRREAKEFSDYESLVNEADKAINKYGPDGELLSFEAYGLYKLNKKFESKGKYEEAVRLCRNGFVWKEAKQLFGIDAYNYMIRQEREESVVEESVAFKWRSEKKQLFLELDKICKDNDLTYLVADSENPCIAMTGGDIEKLVKIVGDNSNRQIEYVINNPRAIDFRYRYCDVTSSDITLTEFRNHVRHGNHIDIWEISKPLNKEHKKKINLRKTVMVLSNIQYKGLLNWELIVGSGIVRFFERIAGKQRFLRKTFDMVRDFSGIDSWDKIKNIEYVSVGKAVIPVKLLNNPIYVEGYGIKFITYEGLLNKRIGKKNDKFYEELNLYNGELSYKEIADKEYANYFFVAVKEYDKYIGHYLWSGFYKLCIKHAQWTYLMTRDYVKLIKEYTDNVIYEIDSHIDAGEIELAKEKLLTYIEIKRKWKSKRVKFLTVPEIEKLLERLN